MRNQTLKLWGKTVVALGLALLASNQAQALPTVTTLGGGQPSNYYGYRQGPTLTSALFHTPCGLAIDSSGTRLVVADRDNNAIRVLDLEGKQTGDLELFHTNLINKPVAVVVNKQAWVYVLNYGKGTNGSVYTFDCNGDSETYGDVFTNALSLTNAAGMAVDGAGNVYVTVRSNQVIRIDASTTTKTTIATITNAGTCLQGLIVKHNGMLAVCDSGRNGIYLIDPTTGVVSTNAGFHGVGDFTTIDNTAARVKAAFNQPMSLAEAGDGSLIVTDYGNNRVKVVSPSGLVSNLYGVGSTYWGGSYPGWYDGLVQLPDYIAPNVQCRQPFGVVMSPTDGTIYTSEDYYHIIREVTGSGLALPQPDAPSAPGALVATPSYGQVSLTWSAVSGATNYYVKRSQTSGGPYTKLAGTTVTTYIDTNVLNGSTYFYVVSASNGGGEGPDSVEASAKVPIPPPAAPRIGWFDYEGNAQFGFYTVLHPVGVLTDTFHNDKNLVIDPVQTGVSTYYIAGPAPLAGIPSQTNGSTPPFYQENYASYITPLSLTVTPDLMIKAVNVDATGQSSATTIAEIKFTVANPVITGNNGAQFTISDETTNAVFWYTLDGTNPINAPPSIGPLFSTNGAPITLSLNVVSNVVFTVRAFRDGYAPSGSQPQTFSPSNFVANTISFGLVSGEASSDFIASPGQSFCAPITLTTLPATSIYSLQFNVAVTNAGPNPGPALAPNNVSFQSMLMKPSPVEGIYEPIPPYAFDSYALVTPNQPHTNSFLYNGNWFDDLQSYTAAENLLSLGWVERRGQTNLYNTKAQDLITYSMAHDVLYHGGDAPYVTIVGGYSFKVPAAATNGQTYQIKIGAQSATSDGVGAAGSSVYIAAPTNGSTAGGGPINALKYVTVGQRKYIVGDVYPFRWFNAGDFGSGGLVANGSANVEQVFQSAVYGLNTPPYDENSTNSVGGYTNVSDMFDAMDSCGGTYVDHGNGYLEFDSYLSGTNATNPLFDGNDTSINQIAFGDGRLDICDVYVTFRRSAGSTSLNWFRRYWANGQRVAEIVPHTALVASKAVAVSPTTETPITSATAVTNAPQVNFAAGDIQGAAGQVVQVPITATILGKYPLRVLMLNLTVEPLDGSPALTTPVQFTQIAALGTPYPTVGSQDNANFSAVWLNSSVAGLTGTATIGTLSVTLPAGASANAAYAVHFDHASASPNGLASFAKQTLTGLITLASRTNSSYGDGIPDSWRLRWFGTTNNLLSMATNCPSNDGVDNWHKFVAGVDPYQANNFPSVNCKPRVAASTNMVIHWPTVSGKQYVIERASSLFSAPWSAISTNNGTGSEVEFSDATSGATHFYRVRILQ